MEDTMLVVSKFFLLFLYVLLFFLLVFSFFRVLSNISLARYFFKIYFYLVIQKHLSDENFCNCLPTEGVFTEQVVRISL